MHTRNSVPYITIAYWITALLHIWQTLKSDLYLHFDYPYFMLYYIRIILSHNYTTSIYNNTSSVKA